MDNLKFTSDGSSLLINVKHIYRNLSFPLKFQILSFIKMLNFIRILGLRFTFYGN